MNYPAPLVAEARRLRAAGWSYEAIHNIFKKRGLDRVPVRQTIIYWCEEEKLDRYQQARRPNRRRVGARKASFELPGRTPEYRAEFMRRLREARVPWSSVAKVHGVVFGEQIDEQTAKARAEAAA